MKTKTMICWEVCFLESVYSSYILKVLSPNGFDYIFYLEFNYEVLIMLFCLFFVYLGTKSNTNEQSVVQNQYKCAIGRPKAI